MSSNRDESMFQWLARFAADTGREFISHETAYDGNFLHGTTLHKRIFHIAASPESPCYLVGYSDPKSLGINPLYFGVFFASRLPRHWHLKIRKKDILDKLNPFLRSSSVSSRNRQFDATAVITASEQGVATNLLATTDIHRLCADVFSLQPGFVIALNDVDTGFVPALNHSSVIGIFTTQAWLDDANLIENLFNKAELLAKCLKESE